MIDEKLLDIICCPKCKGDLELKDNYLICYNCKLMYEIVEDIPVLLIDKAKPLENL